MGRLRELGWIEGRSIAIEYRWSEGRTERYAENSTTRTGMMRSVVL
jgi:putative tryptophan/tyrosine transport system substrate-binding protein